MNNFELEHKNTVQKFLSGVVVIDDQINWDNSDELKTTLTAPDNNDLAPQSDNQMESTVARISSSGIKAQEIINSFSEKGIHCVVYPWQKNSKTLPKIAINTDIVIFDWTLNGKTKTAEELIKNLMEESKNCFRYIVIYTSENPSKVAETVKGMVIYNCTRCPENSSDDEQNNVIDYIYGNDSHVSYRVEIIKKGNDSELCKKIIIGFSNFSTGFLRNAMLTSITSIRENTFKLLSLYPKDLDKAAISHFTSLQSSPAMFNQAEIAFHDYISGLISDNISDILLYSSALKTSLKKDTIVTALADEQGPVWFHDNINTSQKPEDIDINNIKYGLLIQSKNHSEFVMKSMKSKNNFTNKKKCIVIENKILQLKKFSHNDCCRGREKFSLPDKGNHPLKFGTIVSHLDEYYLCLQPLCDSTRLNEDTIFPFVKLKKAEEQKDYFSYVVKKDDNFIALKTEQKILQSLFSFTFSPNEKTEDVRTTENKKDHVFKNICGKDFFWISELKESYVQELAHNIATQGTRIGMNKFEWLRKKSMK